MLDDPLVMADPRKAFTENPYDRRAPPTSTTAGSATCSAASPRSPTRSRARSSPRATTSSSSRPTGTITVGDDDAGRSTGYGLRDHSWGPRYWQAPFYYRWLTANFGDDFGFMGSRIARRDGDGTRGGFVWDGRPAAPLPRLRDQHRLGQGEDRYHRDASRPTLRAKDDDGSPLEWKVHRRGPEPDPAAQPARRAWSPASPRASPSGPSTTAGSATAVGVPRPDRRRPAGRARRVARAPSGPDLAPEDRSGIGCSPLKRAPDA